MSENDTGVPGNGTDSAKQKTNYHMGMEATLKLKYDDVHDSIETLANVHLGQDPPYLDLLILKKDPGLKLSDEIGIFFKENNVIENKGYGDGISINDVFKVQGYAGMYMSLDRNVDEIPWETMTVTVIQYQFPKAAFARLEEMGCKIKERVPDCVYEISGPPIMFPFQLVNASKLGDDWAEIKAMIPGADLETIKKVMQEYHGEGDPRKKQHLRAILRISYANNNEAVERMKETGEMDENKFIETARLLFPEEYERANKLEAKNKQLKAEVKKKDKQLKAEMKKKDKQLEAEIKKKDKQLEAELKKKDKQLEAEMKKKDQQLEAEMKKKDQQLEAEMKKKDQQHASEREADKENTIQNMLQDDIDALKISRWTGVSLEKVAEVAEKMGVRPMLL